MSRLTSREFLRDCRTACYRYWFSKYSALFGDLDIGERKPWTIYDFTKPSTLKKFECISDEQFGGMSSVQFGRSKQGRAVLSGRLDTDIPENTDIDASGHIGIRSFPLYGLFNKAELIDLEYYDCIEMKYRGDGRPYFLNIQSKFSINNMYPVNDVYQHFIFPKGGPHWEVERFPFSQFLTTHQGYLQDVQLNFGNATTIGVSLNDKKKGPFRFEIDYIKLVQVFYQPPKVHHRPDTNPFPDPRSSLRLRLRHQFGLPPGKPGQQWLELPEEKEQKLLEEDQERLIAETKQLQAARSEAEAVNLADSANSTNSNQTDVSNTTKQDSHIDKESLSDKQEQDDNKKT